MFKNTFIFLIFLGIQNISYGMLDQKDKDECTHLMNAARDGQIDKVHYLLNKKSDVNLKNTKGNTALMIATTNKHSQVVAALLKKGANLYCQDSLGRTALILANDMIELFSFLEINTPNELNEIVKLFKKYEIELEVRKNLQIKDLSEIVVSYI